jgi:hypothetical protein
MPSEGTATFEAQPPHAIPHVFLHITVFLSRDVPNGDPKTECLHKQMGGMFCTSNTVDATALMRRGR